MPVIVRFDGWTIRMYFADHNPPHVHVAGPDFHALIAIRTRAIIRGNAPAQILETARQRIAENERQLFALWQDYQR